MNDFYQKHEFDGLPNEPEMLLFKMNKSLAKQPFNTDKITLIGRVLNYSVDLRDLQEKDLSYVK